MTNNITIFGYSGHSFVVCDIFESNNLVVNNYVDINKKENNPYSLNYLGNDQDACELLDFPDYFIAIGDNYLRRKITNKAYKIFCKKPVNAIHKRSNISKMATLGTGVMVSNGVNINALAQIGNGVICNTNCVVEHECIVEDFCHIAPSVTLCGGVKIGKNSFIGANTVINPNIKVGVNVIIGSGSVIIKDVPDNKKIVGNPQRILN